MNETQTQEKRAPGGTGERLCSIPYEAALDAFFWIQHALDGRDVPDHQCEQVQKHKRAISQAIHETQESNVAVSGPAVAGTLHRPCSASNGGDE